MECKDVEKLMKASYGPLFTGKNFSSKLLLKVRRHVLKHDTDFFEGKTADEVDRDALEKMSCASPSSMRYCSDHTKETAVFCTLTNADGSFGIVIYFHEVAS